MPASIRTMEVFKLAPFKALTPLHLDKDCSPTAQPFPSLSGEALEYIGLLAPNCYIAISNYRFFVSREDGFYNVRHVQCIL